MPEATICLPAITPSNSTTRRGHDDPSLGRPLREQCLDVGEQQRAGEPRPELRDLSALRFALLSGRSVETRRRPDPHSGRPATRTGEQAAHRGGGQSRSSTLASVKCSLGNSGRYRLPPFRPEPQSISAHSPAARLTTLRRNGKKSFTGGRNFASATPHLGKPIIFCSLRIHLA